MNITLKLYAGLADHLPPGARDNQVRLVVADGSSVADLIAAQALPARLVHLVLVNGTFIAPAVRADTRLIDEDTLAIWPPIAGG